MTKQEFIYESRVLWLKAKVFFQVKMDGLRLTFAIYMADSLQKARNKRFYVLPNAQNKLIWLCNDDIKIMKRPKKVRKLINGKLREFKVYLIPPKTTHLDVMRDCLYFTPESRNNSNGITVEERNKRTANWLRYMEEYRMRRMFGSLKFKK